MNLMKKAQEAFETARFQTSTTNQPLTFLLSLGLGGMTILAGTMIGWL
jgi:hypothetical protein